MVSIISIKTKLRNNEVPCGQVLKLFSQDKITNVPLRFNTFLKNYDSVINMNDTGCLYRRRLQVFSSEQQRALKY